MPLSKAKNKDRMRKSRLHKRINDLTVQPKPIIDAVSPSIKREGYGKASSTVVPEMSELDADGQPIPDF